MSDKEAGRDYISTVNIDNISKEIKVVTKYQKATYIYGDQAGVVGDGVKEDLCSHTKNSLVSTIKLEYDFKGL